MRLTDAIDCVTERVCVLLRLESNPFISKRICLQPTKIIFFAFRVTCKNVDIVQMNPHHPLSFRGLVWIGDSDGVLKRLYMVSNVCRIMSNPYKSGIVLSIDLLPSLSFSPFFPYSFPVPLSTP